MINAEQRVADLIQKAFGDVTLGDGVGLRQGQGLDDYASSETIAKYRCKDEKHDWSRIPTSELNSCQSSPAFFDAAGKRFHLPAYLIANLGGTLSQDIIFYLCYDAKSWFAALNDLQRNAVREFLLLRLSDGKREFELKRPMVEMIEKALVEHWTAGEEKGL
jgi:hypothetical protein